MPVIPWVIKQGCSAPASSRRIASMSTRARFRALKSPRVGVAHNPTSNLKLGSGVAPVAKMLSLGVTVGIGTTAPPRTTTSTCSRKCGSPPCSPRASTAIRRRCPRARRGDGDAASAHARRTLARYHGSLEPASAPT
jgi:hypothetical protein